MIIVSYLFPFLFLFLKYAHSAIVNNFNNASPSCALCTQGEKQREFPIIDPYYYDPNLLRICDNIISERAIYNGLMSILIKVEDNLRTLRCTNIITHTLPQNPIECMRSAGSYYFPDWAPLWQLRTHPFIGTYIDTMYSGAQQLLYASLNCQLDMRLLMKLVRMSTKLLINRVNCCRLGQNLKSNMATPLFPPSYKFPMVNSIPTISTTTPSDYRFPDAESIPKTTSSSTTTPPDYRFPDAENIPKTSSPTSMPTSLIVPYRPYRPCMCRYFHRPPCQSYYRRILSPPYIPLNTMNMSSSITTTTPSDYRFPDAESIPKTTSSSTTTPSDYRFPDAENIPTTSTVSVTVSVTVPYRPCRCRYFHRPPCLNYYRQMLPQYIPTAIGNMTLPGIVSTTSTTIPSDYRFPDSEDIPKSNPTSFQFPTVEMAPTTSLPDYRFPNVETSSSTSPLDYRFPNVETLPTNPASFQFPTMGTVPTASLPDYKFPNSDDIPTASLSSNNFYYSTNIFRYPYFPPYYAPSSNINVNPSCQSPKRSDGSLWNIGMKSPCPDCDANRDVII